MPLSSNYKASPQGDAKPETETAGKLSPAGRLRDSKPCENVPVSYSSERLKLKGSQHVGIHRDGGLVAPASDAIKQKDDLTVSGIG